MYLYTIKEHPYELARHIATVLHTTAGYLLRWETNLSLAEVYNQKTNEETLFDDDLMKTHYYPFSDRGLLPLKCAEIGI